ncbi:helix-turn-helix domain-containing protein [Fructobacillus tropaeoli]|uniref:helix-turn-helix domain-containing protein n=1 Tax=Fructobacillus tropaeoli TaxID=709323 RepID=UPI0019414ACE|nr:helix-turn-helix domain-containing protein [Fructobacillus tropaeoli]GIC69549.1 helix-turn-helix transcriptional regulator [Fructobacillus tropaeoli]
MEIKQKIEILFNSGISGYAIAKESGVSQPVVNRLMNGQREISNVSLDSAQKLSDLYDKRINTVELPEQYKIIRDVFRKEFKEILESQLELYQEEPNDDDKVLFHFLLDEFKKTLTDQQEIFELGDYVHRTEEPSQSMIDEL